MSCQGVLVARLFGGLGNQMFVYAAARRLALTNSAELVFDRVDGFRNDSYQRFYQLDWFNITGRAATPYERLPFSKIGRALATHRNKHRDFNDRSFIRQEGVAFEPRLLNTRLSGRVYMYGPWQGESYFSDIEQIIRQDLILAKPINEPNRVMADQIAATNAVGMHVRFFAPPGKEKSDNATIGYYRAAVVALEERVSTPHYFVFSDHPEAARDMLGLSGEQMTLVTHNNSERLAPYDMWLMSQCRHFIIANSTFSWWGAWLGTASDKMVYAPAITTDVVGKYASWGFDGLLPDDWVQLPPG